MLHWMENRWSIIGLFLFIFTFQSFSLLTFSPSIPASPSVTPFMDNPLCYFFSISINCVFFFFFIFLILCGTTLLDYCWKYIQFLYVYMLAYISSINSLREWTCSVFFFCVWLNAYARKSFTSNFLRNFMKLNFIPTTTLGVICCEWKFE